MKRSIASFFLFVFCFSITGYSVELHYCNGEITDIAFFGNTACYCETDKVAVHDSEIKIECKKHCHQEENLTENNLPALEKKGCCKTEKLLLTSSKLHAVSTASLKQIFVPAAILFPSYLRLLFKASTLTCASFISPFISKDIIALTQVYRI